MAVEKLEINLRGKGSAEYQAADRVASGMGRLPGIVLVEGSWGAAGGPEL